MTGMSDITYGVVEERYTVGAKTRLSYGIAAFDTVESDGISTVVASIHDITDDRNSLTELVKQCNSSRLSLTHLYDVIADYLSV